MPSPEYDIGQTFYDLQDYFNMDTAGQWNYMMNFMAPGGSLSQMQESYQYLEGQGLGVGQSWGDFQEYNPFDEHHYLSNTVSASIVPEGGGDHMNVDTGFGIGGGSYMSVKALQDFLASSVLDYSGDPEEGAGDWHNPWSDISGYATQLNPDEMMEWLSSQPGTFMDTFAYEGDIMQGLSEAYGGEGADTFDAYIQDYVDDFNQWMLQNLFTGGMPTSDMGAENVQETYDLYSDPPYSGPWGEGGLGYEYHYEDYLDEGFSSLMEFWNETGSGDLYEGFSSPLYGFGSAAGNEMFNQLYGMYMPTETDQAGVGRAQEYADIQRDVLRSGFRTEYINPVLAASGASGMAMSGVDTEDLYEDYYSARENIDIDLENIMSGLYTDFGDDWLLAQEEFAGVFGAYEGNMADLLLAGVHPTYGGQEVHLADCVQSTLGMYLEAGYGPEAMQMATQECYNSWSDSDIWPEEPEEEGP